MPNVELIAISQVNKKYIQDKPPTFWARTTCFCWIFSDTDWLTLSENVAISGFHTDILMLIDSSEYGYNWEVHFTVTNYSSVSCVKLFPCD